MDENGSAIKRRKVDALNSRRPSQSPAHDPQPTSLQIPLPQIVEEVGEQPITGENEGAASAVRNKSKRIVEQGTTKKRRKKRKSIGQQQKRRSKSSLGSKASREQHSSPTASTTNEANDEEDDGIDTALNAKTPPRQRKRASASLSEAPKLENDSEDDLQSSERSAGSQPLGITAKGPKDRVEEAVEQERLVTTGNQQDIRPTGRQPLKKNNLPSPSRDHSSTTTPRDQVRARQGETPLFVTNERRTQGKEGAQIDHRVAGSVDQAAAEDAMEEEVEEEGDDDEDEDEERYEEEEPVEDEEQEEEESDTQRQHGKSGARLPKFSEAKKAYTRKSDVSKTGEEITRHKSKVGKGRERQQSSQQRRAKSASNIERETSGEPPSKDEPIPVTVHRISRLHKLNFLDEEGNDLAGPPPLPKKSSVNAIDVLGQICREMIAKTVENLREGGERERVDKRKAEWRRKRKTVEVFGEELDSRLFQMVCHHHTPTPSEIQKPAAEAKMVMTC